MAGFRALLRTIAGAVLLVAATGLGGCAQYVDRSDTIAFSAGEAANRNAVARMIDPWPVHAANRNIATSGERGARAVRRYQSPPPQSGAPSTVINVGR